MTECIAASDAAASYGATVPGTEKIGLDPHSGSMPEVSPAGGPDPIY